MSKPKTRNENIVIQEMNKEILIYDLKDNKAFCLNETSAIIYQLCDGKRTIREIADVMSMKLKTLVSEDYVPLPLHELKKDRLLENADEFEDYFAGMSRREMVKKVGLASMIALPIISSVIAPLAVSAASICTLVASGNPIPGVMCVGDVSFCNSVCAGTSTSGQCCSQNAIASNQTACAAPPCTCVCV